MSIRLKDPEHLSGIETRMLKMLDWGVFDRAAKVIALDLRCHKFAVAILEPRDATVYRFIFIGGSVTAWRSDRPDRFIHDRYLVTLTMGHSYPWGGGQMHWDYCAGKWADNHEWTGHIVAELLNAVSLELAALDGEMEQP